MVKQKPKKKKKVPPGEFTLFTDEELDRLAQITPTDIEEAKTRWRQSAPTQFANLLDAEPTEEGK